MRLGVNITSSDSYAISQEADVVHGLIDFRELLFDNFVHLDPESVLESLGGRPISLHIMSSGWTTRTTDDMVELGRVVRRWNDVLPVLYVSDHLILVEDPQGRQLPSMREVDYTDAQLIQRAARYQELLGCPLLLENFASESSAGRGQVQFFRRMYDSTGILPLLDFSNAMIAELNGADRARAWIDAGVPLTAGHASGYRPSEIDPSMFIDSHDTPISEETWHFIEDALDAGHQPETCVVERDGDLDAATWLADLRRMRTVSTTQALV